MKEACGIPLHKGAEMEDPNNYWPISILPTTSKFFEGHLSNQLLSFLNKHSLLAKHESGFREGRSCQTALVRLTDEWLKDIDSGKIIRSVSVDRKKVFS